MALLCLIGLGPRLSEASGVPFKVGDVFAALNEEKIQHFSPDGVLLDTLNTATGRGSQNTGMAFDLAGNLYATTWSANSMSKFNNTGVRLGGFGSGFNSNPNSALVDAAGNVYVGQSGGSHQVLKFNASGASLGSFSPAVENGGTDWIALAADQCTLFYTSSGKLIKRFNVCTNTQLSDFATLLIDPRDAAAALRIRPNKEVLVATDQKVFRLDPSGGVIQTYPKPAGELGDLFALNLDPDGTSFWTAAVGIGNVYRIDIATGTLLKKFNAGFLFGGLAIFGENASPPPTPTTLTYTGPTLIANGQPVTLSGILKDDANAPVVGRIVDFTLGTGTSAQSCSGTTSTAGTASCNIPAVAQPLGPGTVKASFAGDAVYLPSADSKATLIFALAARGSFVIGDRSAKGSVTFWGAQWAKVNALSGGHAPNSFKGFANTLSSSPPQCGGSWSTRPGSPPPPDAPLPVFMAVIVASSVHRSGSTISGNISSIVIVKTDPGYEPDPEHPGTGTVVAVLCP
jgi:hypothetical protein